jgi:hypothetical protein
MGRAPDGPNEPYLRGIVHGACIMALPAAVWGAWGMVFGFVVVVGYIVLKG